MMMTIYKILAKKIGRSPKTVYSNRNASIESSLEAFLAGYQPKKTPVAKHTPKLAITLAGPNFTIPKTIQPHSTRHVFQ